MIRRILSLAPLALLVACPGLRTLPPPADEPMIGALSAPTVDSQKTAKANSQPGGASLATLPVPTDPSKIPVPPLVWSAPLISSFADTIQPGVVVYWVPDSSLPLASAQFVWNEGRLALGPHDDAAAGLLGQFLREGGAGGLSSTKLDDTLEFLAASASVSVGMVRTNASVSGLSRDLPFLLNVLGDMLVAPRFDTARLSTIKQRKLQDLEHAFDTPAQCLGFAWDRVAYGPSPWTRVTDSSDVEKLRVDDFRRAMKGRFNPTNLMISVAGSFDKAAVRSQLKTLLACIAQTRDPKSLARLDSIAPVPELQAPGVWIYDTPATQSNIKIGMRFPKRDNPEYYPLMLASEVLGQSGFGSRLVERVRSDEGLAYFVRSFVGSEYDRPAMIGVGLQTKVPSTGRALKIILEEMRLLADSGFRPGELEKARQGLSASVPSLFDTPENTADMMLQSAAWKRKDDHFRRYLRALDTIPDSEVLRVYRKWFVPDSLRIVVAAPADQVRKAFPDGSPGLESYGPVRIWNKDSLTRN
jgi:zinc protease